MADIPEALDVAQRCVLALAGSRGPLLAPMAFWADGSSLWMSTPAASVKAAVLRARPRCAAYIPPAPGSDRGLAVAGQARVYGLHDPLGLAFHGAVVSTAMGALAARNSGTILGYVQDARFVPARFRPRNRVAVRLAVDSVAEVTPPPLDGGIGPPLPSVVPAAVRRALAGQRSVVVAVEGAGGVPVVAPALWGPGYRMTMAADVAVPSSARAAVHVGTDPRRRPTAVVGLALTGRLEQSRLVPRRATWWEGFDLRTVALPEPQASPIVLPE